MSHQRNGQEKKWERSPRKEQEDKTLYYYIGRKYVRKELPQDFAVALFVWNKILCS